MNFLDKTQGNRNNQLKFLTEYGFELDKGEYQNNYYSSDGLYYNRVTVAIEGEYVKVRNYQEYNVGGQTGEWEATEELKGLTKDKVLNIINRVLPDDLD